MQSPDDIYHWYFSVLGPEKIILWAMLICFFGALLTAGLQVTARKFFFYNNAKWISTLRSMQFIFNIQKYKQLFADTSDKVKSTIRMKLGIDYFSCPLRTA